MKNKTLDETIADAKKAEGYLITVTTLRKDKLTHSYFTRSFKKGDIMASLDEQAKLLETEAR